jgi:excinuclease UvrABC ATPase subunit
MKRRAVLATLGASFVPSTTGCTALGQSSPAEEETSDQQPKTSTTTAVNDAQTMEFDPGRVVEEIKLGDQPSPEEEFRPHSLTVWNKASNKQGIQMKITTAKETVLDKEYDLPADTAITVVLQDSAEYIAVLQSEESEASIKIEEKWFDCNHSSTNVVLNESGQFTSEFVTTWLECGSSVTMPDEANTSM